MTKRKVWRYYCEFCRKSGCAAGHMKAHEKSCTLNPDRVCRMHRHVFQREGPPQPSLPLLISTLRDAAKKVDREDWMARVPVEKLREAADGCPACMLAAIRQSGAETREGFAFDFNFTEECKTFWAEINQDRAGHHD